MQLKRQSTSVNLMKQARIFHKILRNFLPALKFICVRIAMPFSMNLNVFPLPNTLRRVKAHWIAINGRQWCYHRCRAVTFHHLYPIVSTVSATPSASINISRGWCPMSVLIIARSLTQNWLSMAIFQWKLRKASFLKVLERSGKVLLKHQSRHAKRHSKVKFYWNFLTLLYFNFFIFQNTPPQPRKILTLPVSLSYFNHAFEWVSHEIALIFMIDGIVNELKVTWRNVLVFILQWTCQWEIDIWFDKLIYKK